MSEPTTFNQWWNAMYRANPVEDRQMAEIAWDAAVASQQAALRIAEYDRDVIAPANAVDIDAILEANNRLQAQLADARAEKERLISALEEADIYLAALNWWEIGSLAKVGEIIGDAIGWDRVIEINAQYRPKITRGLGQEYATLFERNTELVLQNERLERKRVELALKATDAGAEIRLLTAQLTDARAEIERLKRSLEYCISSSALAKLSAVVEAAREAAKYPGARSILTPVLAALDEKTDE